MRSTTTHLFSLLVALLGCACLVESLPSGFIDEDVARVSDGTGAAFVTNQVTGQPMMLVAVKAGRLFAIENLDAISPTRKVIMNITDRTCDNGERGLQAVAPHPNFDQNKWLYLFYTRRPEGETECTLLDPVRGPRNTLSRVKVGSDNMVDVTTEEILLTTPPLVDFNHNGGALLFGVDGYLYVTLGDGGDHADGYSQQLNILLGKILRLTDEGGIPPDNPYVGANSARCNLGNTLGFGQACQEIHSIGLRNPFRLAMDMNSKDKVRFRISDVGGNTWEEIDEGVLGGNYGWPAREGPCSLGSVTNCAANLQGYQDPFYWYLHSDDGGAVVGGTFVPEDSGWPEEFMGGFLFAEFVFGKILLLQEKPDDACSHCVPPVPGFSNTTFHEWERPVDLIFGPYRGGTALYYTARRGAKNVRRIRYLGGDNNAPTANITSDVTTGEAPLVVNLDGTGSTDPDGDGLTYEWDFGALGTATDSAASVTFEQPGVYSVSLTVRDSSMFSNTASLEIIVGVPPVAVMDSPPEGTTFAVGDVLIVSGQALDQNGNDLTNFTMFWEVRQHHNTHFHPYMGLTRGNSFTIPPAPEPEDFLAATNSNLEILLYVYNEFGLSSVISRTIMPKTRDMFVDTIPSGLELMVGDYPVKTPATVTVWQNDDLSVEAPDQSGVSFASWSDGGAAKHNIRVLAANELSFVATFSGQLVPTAAGAPTSPPIPDATVPPATASPVGMATAAPATMSPVTMKPVTMNPATMSPVTMSPVTMAPVTTSPVAVVPGTSSPVTIAPIGGGATIAPAGTTTSPVTMAPVTLAPVTASPVTMAPVTGSPVTKAPITQAPVTASPVTASPTTANPSATPSIEPTTAPPSSANGLRSLSLTLVLIVSCTYFL